MKKFRHIMSINEFFFYDTEPKLKPGFNLLGKFTNDEFDEFCEVVYEWQRKTEEPVGWDLYISPYIKQSGRIGGRNKETAKRYWDMYVSDGVEFHVVEKGDTLYGYTLENGQVKNIYDHKDKKVNPSEIFVDDLSVKEHFFYDTEPKLKPGFNLLGKFTNDEFDEFCEVVSEWQMETENFVGWDLYINPSKQSDRRKKQSAKGYWDMYVSDGVEFHVVEKGDTLYGYTLENGQVKNIYDNTDKKVNPSEIFVDDLSVKENKKYNLPKRKFKR